MNTKSITGRIPKDKRQLIFSRGSRTYQHATSPLCRPTLGGSEAKRCCTNPSTQLDTTRTYPQVRSLNDTSNPLELPFGSPPGKAQDPSQSPEPATNNHQLVTILLRCSKPSRWWQPPRETSESHSETQIPSASRCNHSSNALKFSPNLTMMMDQ